MQALAQERNVGPDGLIHHHIPSSMLLAASNTANQMQLQSDSEQAGGRGQGEFPEDMGPTMKRGRINLGLEGGDVNGNKRMRDVPPGGPPPVGGLGMDFSAMEKLSGVRLQDALKQLFEAAKHN